MPLNPIFKIREQVTESIIRLLEQTTLGTNGAKYKHLDTSRRIHESDNPLFLTLERNDKVLGNITFCRREKDWYIRYFAFHSLAQAGEKKKKEDKGNSLLKRELNQFFDDCFTGKTDGNKVRSMYAYIDPKNDRSIWMSANFGFHVIRQLATQSFSRVKPQASDRLEHLYNWEEIKELVESNYGDHGYYINTHASKAPFYVLRNEFGEIIACTRVTKVNWQIVRMPGKLGGILTKAIPFVPVLRKLIRPDHHTFLVPEIVCIKNNDPKILDELFSSILERERLNLILWWIDSREPLYVNVKNKMDWGLLHKLIGSTPVDVVQKTANNEVLFNDRPVFVTAWDMV
jgi:hypothetical protein